MRSTYAHNGIGWGAKGPSAEEGVGVEIFHGSISTAETVTLVDDISLQRVIESHGVKLKRERGGHLRGRCPFHASRSDTLVIDTKANTWSCAGKCRTKKADVAAWVMKVEGISRTHAVELLKEGSFATTKARKKPTKVSTVRKLAAPFEPGEEDHVVLQRVVDLYAESLASSSTAKDYLRQRGLDDAELIRHFQLGYSHRQLGYRLPARNRAAGAALRGQLIRLGVMRESGHEHLSGSLVVPILDVHGRVIDLYGRKVTHGLRAGTALHLSLGPEPKGQFNLQGVLEADDVILCKSVLDVLSFWRAGITNTTATFGLDGFTDGHRDLLAAPRVRRFLVAFDRSKAGDNAAEKVAAELVEKGKQVFRVVFPHGQDANDYLRADGNLEELVRSAQWMGGARTAPLPTQVAAQGIEPEQTNPAPPMESEAPEGPTGPKDHLSFTFGSRTWRVRGHLDCTSLASLRVNLRVVEGSAFFSDTFDLLVARARQGFLKQAAEELEVEERILKADLGTVILAVEDVVDQQLRAHLDSKPTAYEMSDAEVQQAMELLTDPKLTERILGGFEACGVVGEHNNKLLGYLVGLSRRLDSPLAVVIQSSSAAGKSSLLDAILRFVPEEDQVAYSAMTGQSLFYFAGGDLKHKLLSIEEEAGVSQAAYALRVLQSAGELTIASTGKDATTGRLSAHEYKVTGPVAIMLTTTSIDVDDELLNRCLVLTVDESRQQTQAIQQLQREGRTLDGLMAKTKRAEVAQLQRNVQRLLKPVRVVNPFAIELTFPARSPRSRRDQQKLLTLIDTIAYLHQHQRPHRTVETASGAVKYIEVERQDVELALKLTEGMFDHAVDDVPPQTARMLTAITAFVQGQAKVDGLEPHEVRFSRRQLREDLGWGEKQARVHLDRLVELEHLVRHRGRQGQRYLYSVPDTSTMPTSSTEGPTSSTLEGKVSLSDPAAVGELRPLAKGMVRAETSKSSRRRRGAR